MIANEQQVKLAARLYECRDAAKALYGKEYKAELKWYISRIYDYQKQQKVETLPAVLAICSLPTVKENASTTMLFMAAAVEIIEPSND
jgi:hypothetical protein